MPEQQGDESVEDPQVAESVLTADRRSKIAGLFVAIGVFVIAQLTTSNPQFNATIAAVAGIGIRIYIPYHASRAVTDPDAMSIASHPETGNYHYGAVGLALLAVSLVGFVAMAVTGRFSVSFGAGVAGGIVSYAGLRLVLPRA